MAEVNTIPPLSNATQIVNPDDGKPTQQYILWSNNQLEVLRGAIIILQNQVTNLQNVQASLVAAQAQATAASVAAAQAQATADGGSGGGGATSGQAQGTINVGAAWSTAAVVSLSGVVAGNLTIAGSGPQQTTATTISAYTTIAGAWRVVEVIGGVDTVVYSGTFQATRTQEPTDFGGSFDITFLFNDNDTSQVSIARSTTGTMDYRLDLMGAGGFTITSVLGFLYVRRAP